MLWFQNLTTGLKLHLGFGLVMLFLGATAWIGHSEIGRLQEAAEKLHERDFGLALELSEIRTDLARDRLAQLEVKGLAADPARARLIGELRRHSADLDVRLQRVSALAALDPQIAGRLTEMKKALAEYRKARDVQLALLEQGSPEGTASGDEVILYEKVRDASIAVGQTVQERAAADVEVAKSEGQGISKTFIMLAALAFLCVALLVMLLNHAIARPLVRISGMAERVAAGDLTVEVPESGRSDEVGVMQAMFGKMVSALRHITRQIHEATGVLAGAATEIMAATTQLASSATQTASAVAQTTTTLEEVKQTSQASSHKAKAVSDEARKAAEVAGAGRRSVEETIEGMEGIQRQMSTLR